MSLKEPFVFRDDHVFTGISAYRIHVDNDSERYDQYTDADIMKIQKRKEMNADKKEPGKTALTFLLV